VFGAASEMTKTVSGRALNSTHSLTVCVVWQFGTLYQPDMCTIDSHHSFQGSLNHIYFGKLSTLPLRKCSFIYHFIFLYFTIWHCISCIVVLLI